MIRAGIMTGVRVTFGAIRLGLILGERFAVEILN